MSSKIISQKTKEICFDKIRFVTRIGSLDETIINEVWKSGMYSTFLGESFSKSVIIDVGAHIGGFSLMAAHKHPNSIIYCYEPHPDNFNLLKANIALNGFEDRIHPFQLALAENTINKTLYLHSGDNTGMHSIIKSWSAWHNKRPQAEINTIAVKCTTLKSVFESNNIKTCYFLKMDCEGAETKILTHASNKLLSRIRCISMETHSSRSIKSPMETIITESQRRFLFFYLRANSFSRYYWGASIYNFINKNQAQLPCPENCSI
jgi:FkbM family methyltransferase